MATHEGARWIEEQLQSIASQSRPPDEIVVCDDRSGDDTLACVERFAERTQIGIHIERNSQRLGTTKNFEKAVRLCHGDVIFLADQDDVWAPQKVAVLTGFLECHPEAGLVFSNAEVVDDALHPLGYDLWRALGFSRSEQRRLAKGRACEVFARHVVAAGTTLAFRTCHRDLVLPFPRLPSVHDAWIAFLIAAVADCHTIDRALLRYRLHDANQIGIKRFSLREQVEQARRQLAEGAFERAARFFDEARERLALRRSGESQPTASTLALIDAKIEHSRIRDDMPDLFWKRLPSIVAEAIRGRYWRYSYGSRSIAQDLWLR